jgi:indole-3-glycerol phosphate synthase
VPGGLGTPERVLDADEEACVRAPSPAPQTSGAISIRALLAERQSRVPLPEVKAKALDRPTPPNGREALTGSHVAVVAELEPGPTADCMLRAEQYEADGAAVIAVPAVPNAGLEVMDDVNAHTEVPLFSLEPVVCSYQLWEARAHGASLVLLHPSLVTDEALISLVERAGTIGLTVVVEVRSAHDLVRALRGEATTLLLRPALRASEGSVQSTLAKLLPLVPAGVVRVATSGASPRSDLLASAKLDADAFFIPSGQLVGDGKPGETVAALAALAAHPAVARRRAA